MWYTSGEQEDDIEELQKPPRKKSELLELEQATVAELGKMRRLYVLNTAFTLLGALAGWFAFGVVMVVWLL